MNIPFCRMISMHVVRPTFKINVLKMEQAFQTRYHEGEKVSYVSPLNWNGKEQFVDSYIDYWNAHWHSEMKIFNNFFLEIQISSFYQVVCFFIWDGNHRLQTWLPYIQHVHNEDPKWHTQWIPLCSTPHIALWSSTLP